MEVTDSGRSDYIDSLRLSPREHAAILDELDASNKKGPRSDRRTEERLRFTEQALLFVQMRHPGGSIGHYLVRTRNLSRTGIGFLHGSFIYNGTGCTVALRTTDNKIVEIDGKVVRCAHVRGHIHEVGVRFGKAIRLRSFLGSSAPTHAEDESSSELPRLQGRVLYVEDSQADQDLLKFHLGNLGVVCDVTTSGMDALDVAESVKYDLIISGLHLPGMTGFELAESLRQSGYKGPLVAMSADESDTARVEALSRGFTSMLAKPYCFEDLLKLLTGYLKSQAGAGAGGGGEKLVSVLWGDQQMRPLIQRFVLRLEPQLREMRRLCDVQGAEPLLRKHYMDLKGSAGGYGFPTISKAAQHLLDLPETGAQPDEVRKRREALDRLCMAAIRAVESATVSQQAA